MGELLSLLCLLQLLPTGHQRLQLLPKTVSLLLLVVPVAYSRHLLSVIELGGLYYYDSSDLIVNKTFQVGKLYCDEIQRCLGKWALGNWACLIIVKLCCLPKGRLPK